MATAGRVLLISKGAWVSGNEYVPMDYVYYGGNSYVCKSATSGTTTPDNDTKHWQLMASGFDMDMITQTITNEQNKIASDAAVYAETVKLEAQDAALAANIATVETTSTASQPYSVGQYLVLGGILYKVTTAIASGGTITPGTNVDRDTVGGELTSLKDAFTKFYYKHISGTSSATGTISTGIRASTYALIAIINTANTFPVFSQRVSTDYYLTVYVNGQAQSNWSYDLILVYAEYSEMHQVT